MNITTLNMTTLDGGVIIKKGGGTTPTPPSGGGEERAGMTYITKETLVNAFGNPMPDSMTQAELRQLLLVLFAGYPISGMKKTNGTIYPFGIVLGEEIDESRFTYAEWEALSFDWDAIRTTSSGNIPTWKSISQEVGTSTVDEFKGLIQQMFPNQLTEEEFFNK